MSKIRSVREKTATYGKQGRKRACACQQTRVEGILHHARDAGVQPLFLALALAEVEAHGGGDREIDCCRGREGADYRPLEQAHIIIAIAIEGGGNLRKRGQVQRMCERGN